MYRNITYMILFLLMIYQLIEAEERIYAAMI